jgi:UMF1 family MFS transporter
MARSVRQERLSLFGWLSYDFANTIFSMNILTMYFAQWIIIDLGYPDIYYSTAYSISMIVVALTLPILGHRSDLLSNRKRYLVLFAFGCIAASTFLGISVFAISDIAVLAILALVSVAVANYFYEGSLVFYNALLPSVSNKSNVGTVSGLGVGLGYVGAIVGLLLIQPVVDGAIPWIPAGRQSAFLPTAMLFLLFFLPTFLFLKDKQATVPVLSESRGLERLWKDLRDARKYPGAFRFLIADFLFEDAIATLIIFMAVYAEKVMGFPDSSKITLFIVSTISAVIGSVLSGRISDRLGHYRMLKTVVCGWVLLLTAVAFTTSRPMYWVLGSIFGVLLGSTWTISRPLLNQLVPERKLGLFYGLYSLSGRAAAVLGPILWGLVVLRLTSESAVARLVTGTFDALGVSVQDAVLQTIQYRFAVGSLAILVLIGLIIYWRIPDPAKSGLTDPGS